jgi:polyisoprenyl-teichoic acid--peptidoglycan teichoic acid transferase
MIKQRKYRFLVIAVGLLITVVILGGIFYPRLKQKWETPLGPGLELPTHTPTMIPATATAPETATQEAYPANGASTESEGQGAENAVSSTPSPTSPPPTPTAQPLCGGPETMTLLAVGADSGIDYLYGLSDVIRMVRVDFVTPKVTMLSMPRDLWVELPEGIGKPGADPITHSKLNQAYFYGSPGMGYYDGPGAGPGLLARTLDLNFGLRADHYGAVNMQTFVKIVNAIGGIDIYLPTDVDGRPIDEKTEDMGYFYAGQQHFNGDQALRFARIRKKYNDFTRMDHQNMVMCAVREKLMTPQVLPKIPQIIASFNNSVLTDLSPEQISQLVCLLPQVKRENLIFTSLPEEILKPGRVYSPIQKDEVFVMQADFDVIRDYAEKFMAGTWPTEPDEPTCP